MSLNPLQDFYKQTLTAPTGTGAGKIYLSSKPTPTNGYIVISPSNQTLREIIRYTGSGTDSGGDYVNVASASDRGLGGTSAQAHSTGESVRINLVSSWVADLIAELNTLNTKIDTAVISGALDASTTVKGIGFLTANPQKTLGTCTITIASPAVITKVAHGLQAGDSVKFTTTDTLPTGITAGVTYYVIATGLTADAFQISATYGGTALNTADTQMGTHTLYRVSPYVVGDNDPRIPTTGQGAALAGSQGTPSATNKYETQDHTSSDYNASQLTRNAGTVFGVVDTVSAVNRVAQSFIAQMTKIRGVTLYKDADTGTFTGDVTIELFADSAGSPTGSALATLTYTNAEWKLIDTGAFEAFFATEYAGMVQGSKYWISIKATTADNSNHPNLGINSAGGYADGEVKRWNTADGWVLVTTIDLYFKINDGVVSQLVKTNTQGIIPSIFFGKKIVRTYTVPGNYNWQKEGKLVLVEVWGGGGGGAGRSTGGTSTWYGGGGGGGAYMWKLIDTATLPDTVTVTVGQGGARATTGRAGNGTSSQFNNNAFGTNGGYGGTGQNDWGGGGGNPDGEVDSPVPSHGTGNNAVGTLGAVQKTMCVPFGLRASNQSFGGFRNGLYSGSGGSGNSTGEDMERGGNSMYGGGGGGGRSNALGGKSMFAGNGGNGGTDATPQDGFYPAGGGGGGGGNNLADRFGGNGANGMVRITII